jgi:hypothetical protein
MDQLAEMTLEMLDKGVDQMLMDNGGDLEKLSQLLGIDLEDLEEELAGGNFGEYDGEDINEGDMEYWEEYLKKKGMN